MSDAYPYQSSFRLFPVGVKPKILLIAPEHLREFTQEIAHSFANSAEMILAQDNMESILDNIEGVHGILGCPRHLFTSEMLERNGGVLKWVHAGGAGVEQFIIKELVESDIVFTNGRIIQGPECADHALALLLALTRNIQRIVRGEKGPLPRPIELMGKTAVVTGIGGIGLLIAERLAAFGTRIIGVDNDYMPMMSLFHDLVRTDQLHDVLPSADLVITAVPHTSRTGPLFGQDEFSLMKKGACFVNVSRGRTVDTAALTAALDSGHLAGAGLDVTDPEPLPEDHPLRLMSNVVLTPHTAGLSDCNRERAFNLMKENIARFINKQPLLNVVNKKLGY